MKNANMAVGPDIMMDYDTATAAEAADYQEEGASWRGQGFLGGSHSTPRVSYYFPQDVGHYHFGEHHPMKPHRLELTNHLVAGYDLFRHMDVYTPRTATRDELAEFHESDYVNFLSRVTPDNVQTFANILSRFNIGDDCPIFDGLYDYCRQYAGASLAASRKLATGQTDIAVNWTGGLHHAKKFEASGFCYVNDIVLAILQLLRVHPRVLYVDIDIHHGDGVQEAFYNSNRVLTVSFHKFSESFFPGTGHVDEIGNQLGKYFSLNVPLQDGIDDESYVALFKSIMEPTVMTFQPSVIVLQCGADSLGCDRLGCFNLSISAHGECVRFMKAFGIPLLVLGGGGYTIRNVARCWTYETAVLLDAQHQIPNALPSTPFDAFFAPDYKLHPPLTGRVDNANSRHSIERIRQCVLERLRFMHGAPSVALQEIPPDIATWLVDDDDKNDDAENQEMEEKDEHDAWMWASSASKGRDAHRGSNEYFGSRRDNDKSPASSTGPSGRKRSLGATNNNTGKPTPRNKPTVKRKPSTGRSKQAKQRQAAKELLEDAAEYPIPEKEKLISEAKTPELEQTETFSTEPQADKGDELQDNTERTDEPLTTAKLVTAVTDGNVPEVATGEITVETPVATAGNLAEDPMDEDETQPPLDEQEEPEQAQDSRTS